MKKIIVACSSGIATSQTVATKIQRMLKERKISAKVEAVDVKSIKTHIKDSDVYVKMIPDKNTYEIPVINGIAFLTGIGMEAEFDKILAALK